MPRAARINDGTSHAAMGAKVGVPGSPTGTLKGTGVPTVLIEGKPAAVVGPSTFNSCNVPPQHKALTPGNFVKPDAGIALRRVEIGVLPLAAMGDETVCGAVISGGAPTVIIGGGL